jgi:uncharacterized membrane protein SpoIIM required for sporulation
MRYHYTRTGAGKKRRIQSEKIREKTKFVISSVILTLLATFSLLILSKVEAYQTPTFLNRAAVGSGIRTAWKPACAR